MTPVWHVVIVDDLNENGNWNLRQPMEWYLMSHCDVNWMSLSGLTFATNCLNLPMTMYDGSMNFRLIDLIDSIRATDVELPYRCWCCSCNCWFKHIQIRITKLLNNNSHQLHLHLQQVEYRFFFFSILEFQFAKSECLWVAPYTLLVSIYIDLCVCVSLCTSMLCRWKCRKKISSSTQFHFPSALPFVPLRISFRCIGGANGDTFDVRMSSISQSQRRGYSIWLDVLIELRNSAALKRHWKLSLNKCCGHTQLHNNDTECSNGCWMTNVWFCIINFRTYRQLIVNPIKCYQHNKYTPLKGSITLPTIYFECDTHR